MSSVIHCLADLTESLQTIPELGNRVSTVFDPDELVRIIKGVSASSVGVVYEGMQSIQELGSTNRGLASTAMFGLYLAVDSTSVTNHQAQKNQAIALLALMRKCLSEKRSPGGNYWQFSSEGYASSFPNKALWIQKWSTRLMLPG